MTATTGNRLLLGYSVVMTTVLAGLVFSQALSGPSNASFEQLDVRRINVREQDGTLRMTISSSDTLPGMIVKGKESPRSDRKGAGMLFFDDEGTESGGLLFSAAQRNGKVAGYGHLSFDQYQQDQVLTLTQSEEDGRRRAGLSIIDRPDTPIPWDLVERKDTPAGKAEIERLASQGAFGAGRIFVGKTHERDSIVLLQDGKGRARLTMKVTLDGAASIDFLDENGESMRTLTPTPARDER